MKAQAPPESLSTGRIQTFSGLFVDPLNMTPGEVHLPDIAHALGNICRFTGHSARFLSVAEHSINVCLIVDYLLRGVDGMRAVDRDVYIRTKLIALLHDASEAYLNDVSRPLKNRPEFEFYRQAEYRLQQMIYEKYLPLHGVITIDWDIIKAADDIALGFEARDLMWCGAPPDDWASELDGRDLKQYQKWLDCWPYVKMIPDELYYKVSVAQAPPHKRTGERRAVLGDREAGGAYDAGQEWLEMVRGLLEIVSPGAVFE